MKRKTKNDDVQTNMFPQAPKEVFLVESPKEIYLEALVERFEAPDETSPDFLQTLSQTASAPAVVPTFLNVTASKEPENPVPSCRITTLHSELFEGRERRRNMYDRQVYG